MKDLLVIMVSTIVASAAIIGAALLIALLTYEAVSTQPTPTTYHTGLYVESDQLQKTIDGKELQ